MASLLGVGATVIDKCEAECVIWYESTVINGVSCAKMNGGLRCCA